LAQDKSSAQFTFNHYTNSINMVFQVAALIPAGMAIAKAQRNASDASGSSGGSKKSGDASKVRTQGVVDRLTAGGSGAPIAQWSDQHLERMIKTNSAFKSHADELRTAHAAARK